MSAAISIGALLTLAFVFCSLVLLILKVHEYFVDQRKAADDAYDKGKRYKP
jgi:hypothetical protein